MKALCVAPDLIGYTWQVDMLCASLIRHGFSGENITVLTYQKDLQKSSPMSKVRDKYGLNLHYYTDDRDRFLYDSSIRPYLIHKYLLEDPSRENESYFYIDSDIILTQDIDFEDMAKDGNSWYGSDVSSYASLGVLSRNGGHDHHLLKVCNMDKKDDRISQLYTSMPGCQWVLNNPTSAIMYDVYEKCEDLYSHIVSLFHKGEVQRTDSWLTDMFVLPVVATKHGKECLVSNDLSFTLADSKIEQFYHLPIYHNSGVSIGSARKQGIFSKSMWGKRKPFSFLHICDPQYASYGYVEFMRDIYPDTKIEDIHIENTVGFDRLRSSGNSDSDLIFEKGIKKNA